MTKRERATEILLNSVASVDKHTDADNVARYTKIFKDMSDSKFDEYMHQLRDGKACLYVYIPNMEKHPDMNEMVALANKFKVMLSSRITMTDSVTGKEYLTPERYMVVRVPTRRQQQFGEHKISIPKGDNKIDAMTGQVIGVSRAAGITNPEIQSLKTKGLDILAKELVSIRGGDIEAYQTGVRKQGEETGTIRISEMPTDSKNRTIVTAQVWLEGMHLLNNIAGG